MQFTDEACKPVAQFLWDAQTGQLASVSREVQTAGSMANPITSAWTGLETQEQTKARAACLAYGWLCRLGMAEDGSHWRLVCAPERTASQSAVWCVTWRSRDRQAVELVDVGSQQLVAAQYWRPSCRFAADAMF